MNKKLQGVSKTLNSKKAGSWGLNIPSIEISRNLSEELNSHLEREDFLEKEFFLFPKINEVH